MTTHVSESARPRRLVTSTAAVRPRHRSCTTVTWVVVGATSAGWALGWLGVHVSHDDHPRWLLARISGLAGFALMTALVSLGLGLAHPRGTAFRSVPRSALISLHIGL